MKASYRCLIIFLFPFSLLVSTAFAAESLTPEQIARRTYDRYLGDDMQMQGRMELISSSGHVRNREFVSMRKDSRNERKQLIRFTAPADINGTAFLNIEADGGRSTEQHLYLPALKRTRRIVASQKGRSFVNSDFTYEDMQRHPVEEWDYRLSGDETVAGYSCYVLISTPKPGTDTQYGKLVAWIEKANYMPLKTHFFDNKGQHVKIYSVNRFEMIDKIPTETDVQMEDLLAGHKTRLRTLEIKYNTGLKDTLFTTRSLEQ